MICTCNLISAKEAFESGLLTKVVEADKLQEEVSKVIEKLKSRNQGKLRLVKRLINNGLRGELKAGLESETREYSKVLSSEDTKSEIRSFLVRRNRG